MVVLLHSNHPWNVVECHGTESEISVIWNLAYFLDETIKIGGGDAVDSGQEIGRGKAIMISWRTTALETTLVIFERRR